MALIGYGKLLFDNDFVAVYEFGEHPDKGAEGSFVVAKNDTTDYRIITTRRSEKFGELIYGKTLRLLSSTGEWPRIVPYAA